MRHVDLHALYDAPAEPVKNTFCPDLTMSSTSCCSADSMIDGEGGSTMTVCESVSTVSSAFHEDGVVSIAPTPGFEASVSTASCVSSFTG